MPVVRDAYLSPDTLPEGQAACLKLSWPSDELKNVAPYNTETAVRAEPIFATCAWKQQCCSSTACTSAFKVHPTAVPSSGHAAPQMLQSLPGEHV